MKINKLAIKDFINHEDTCLDFSQSKIHIFVGANDQGKSAILDAISYGLTGYAREIKERKDQHFLIRNGAKSAEVALGLDNLSILRHRTLSGETLTVTMPDGISQTGTTGQDAIYQTLQTSPETLKALLHHSNLVNLPPEQLKALIFHILNIQATPETIKNKLLAKEISASDIGKAAEIIDLAVSQGFEAAEREAVMRRRVAKRERDNLGDIPAPDNNFNLDGKVHNLASLDIDVIKKNLESLKDLRDKLLEEKGRAKSLADNAGLTERKKDLESQIRDLKDRTSRMDKTTLVANISDVKKDIHGLTNKQIQLVSQKSSLQEQMLALDPGPGNDDTCPRYKTPCPVDQAQKEQFKKDITETASRLKDQYDSVFSSLQQLEKELAGKNKLFDKYQASLTSVNVAAEQLTQAEKIYAELLKQQPENPSASPPKSLEEIEKELQQLAARIARGEKLLQGVQDYKTNSERHSATAARTQELSSEISLWDRLANSFNPKNGIMGEIVQEALNPIYQRFQKTQHLLEKPITLDDNFNILANGQPAKTLSGSGKLRTSIILKDALCQTAGLKFFVEDEVNLLDQNNKGTLVKTLLELADDYDTIILCAAIGDTPPKPSPDPRIQMWLVKDGKVRQIKDTKKPATLNV